MSGWLRRIILGLQFLRVQALRDWLPVWNPNFLNLEPIIITIEVNGGAIAADCGKSRILVLAVVVGSAIITDISIIASSTGNRVLT